MKQSRKTVSLQRNLVIASALLCTVWINGAEAADHNFCNLYSHMAANQFHENLNMNCGLGGPRWNADWKYHYDWCRNAPENVVHGETHARKNMLKACKNKTPPSAAKGGHQECNLYAQMAMHHQNRNKFMQCGFSGNRWSPVWDHHYNWCRNVEPAASQGESHARQNMLKKCSGK